MSRSVSGYREFVSSAVGRYRIARRQRWCVLALAVLYAVQALTTLRSTWWDCFVVAYALFAASIWLIPETVVTRAGVFRPARLHHRRVSWSEVQYCIQDESRWQPRLRLVLIDGGTVALPAVPLEQLPALQGLLRTSRAGQQPIAG